MYIVRSIQSSERPKWVDQVGVKSGATLLLAELFENYSDPPT